MSAENSNGNRCETCRFWAVPTDGAPGTAMEEFRWECKRYPPTMNVNRHPLVWKDDWCGEWKERPDA